jgi:hypothetical protein
MREWLSSFSIVRPLARLFISVILLAVALCVALAQGQASVASTEPGISANAPGLDDVDAEMAEEMAAQYNLSIPEATERVRIQRAAVEFKEDLPASVQSEWAGGVVDVENGTRRHWFVASSNAKDALDDKLAEFPEFNVETKVVDHTLNELQEAAETVSSSLRTSGLVATSVNIDVLNNELVVGVPGNDKIYAKYTSASRRPTPPSFSENADGVAGARARLSRASGIPIRSKPDIESTPATPAGCTNSQISGGVHLALECDDPMRGGPMIWTDLAFPFYVGCSAGFQVRSKSDNSLYMLTSGHCAPAGNGDGDGGRGRVWWAHMPKDGSGNYAKHQVGTWWRGVVNNDDGDGGIIKVTNPTGWRAGSPIVFVGASQSSGKDTTLNASYQIQSQGTWLTLDIGDWLCKTGGADWTDCGSYQGGEVVDVGDEDGLLFSTILHRFDTMRVCQGDSGGPVLGNGKGWGLVTSQAGTISQMEWEPISQEFVFNSACGTRTYVMALPRLMNALNISLVTVANP